MQISIVIPVYNAASFVTQAVESALAQPETAEVILIEDGSTDNSLAVCQALAEKYEKVRLLRHPCGNNRGAGATRNLGVINSNFEFIAFLDADDFYSEDRFTETKRLFNTFSDIDGVYEAIGYYYDESFEGIKTDNKLTTMNEIVPPERLFEKQAPIGNAGYCSINGWTVKKSIFKINGLFDEDLPLHQDTVMLVKFAALGRMVPGVLDAPVAMRRIHGENRITKKKSGKNRYFNRVNMWENLWVWGKMNLSPKRQKLILEKFINCITSPGNFGLENRFFALQVFMKLIFRHPDLMYENYVYSRILYKIKHKV
ncbi:MAG: glycosyltransferase family 2 protein [Candidatus Helarchaeota archaeon]